MTSVSDAVRERLLDAYRAALDAVDPERATAEALRRDPLTPPVRVVAIGKAASGMARGAASAQAGITAMLVASDHDEPVPDGAEVVIGSHPAPDAASVVAGEAVLRFVAAGREGETLLVLVSGGGSAIVEVPRTGWAIDDIAALADGLMGSGAPIDELNTVRRHLSRIKNGGLLRASTASAVVSLLISDVVDGAPAVIASGPTLADGSTAADAVAIVRRRLGEELDLEELAGAAPIPHQWEVIADGARAAIAAASVLGGRVATTSLTGEARHEAVELCAHHAGEALVAAGETTVTVTGGGRGGRNQEAALAAALAIEGSGTVFAALGTDGVDGPTPAAGAIVDGGSAERIRSAGVDPAEALADNDAHTALAASGDLVVTGPSGTNVGDLWMVASP